MVQKKKEEIFEGSGGSKFYESNFSGTKDGISDIKEPLNE